MGQNVCFVMEILCLDVYFCTFLLGIGWVYVLWKILTCLILGCFSCVSLATMIDGLAYCMNSVLVNINKPQCNMVCELLS